MYRTPQQRLGSIADAGVSESYGSGDFTHDADRTSSSMSGIEIEEEFEAISAPPKRPAQARGRKVRSNPIPPPVNPALGAVKNKNYGALSGFGGKMKSGLTNPVLWMGLGMGVALSVAHDGRVTRSPYVTYPLTIATTAAVLTYTNSVRGA